MERKTKVILLIIVALVVALALVVILVASLRKDDGDTADPPTVSDGNNIPSTENPLPSINDPIYEGKDISSSPFVGNFRNTYSSLYASDAADVFETEQEIPLLTINADGSFELRIYDAEAGSLAVRGAVIVDGEAATFTIEERPESISFLGDDVTNFKMTLVSETDMRYTGEPLGSISKGDVFSRVDG